MPVLDGIAAAERIAGQRIAPVVILTAFSQRDLVERARDAGAMAYLVKPFTKTDLVPAIEMAVSRFAELAAARGRGRRPHRAARDPQGRRPGQGRAPAAARAHRARGVPLDPEDRDGPAALDAPGRRGRRRRTAPASPADADRDPDPRVSRAGHGSVKPRATPRVAAGMWRNPPSSPLDCRAAPSRVRGGRTELMSRHQQSVSGCRRQGRRARSSCCSCCWRRSLLLLAPAGRRRRHACACPRPTSRLHRGHHAAPSRTSVAGVDVILTKPDGARETVTTGDDGKWNVEVTEQGDYLRRLDRRDTLPKDRRGHRPGEVTVRRPSSARPRRRSIAVRTSAYDCDADEQVRRAPPELGQRPPPRPAAGAGLDRPLA